MANEPRLTDDLKARIGRWTEPSVIEVEKGAIRRFAQAVEDGNPLYADEEYARSTRHGGIVCPPGFFGWPVKDVAPDWLPNLVGRPFEQVLNTGNETEFYRPVRPGDVLVCTTRLADAYEKKGSGGTLLFVILESDYKNQGDELVARMRYMFAFY